MISAFAMDVMNKQPDYNKPGCDGFKDINWESKELKSYIKLACELGLMWLEKDGSTPKQYFNWSDVVTRAQFGTVLSRLLYWKKHNIDSEDKAVSRYQEHLNALKQNEIMTKIDWDWPNRLELRWYSLIMLMRVWILD